MRAGAGTPAFDKAWIVNNIGSGEILVYMPTIRARFDAPLPAEGRFGSPVQRNAFRRGRQRLSRARCPYCRSILARTDGGGMAMNRGWGTHVKSCGGCGWWFCEEMQTPVGGEPDTDFSDEEWGCTFVEGILQKFRVDDLAIPVQILRDYIHKKPGMLHDLHPRKFEELVASILRDFFDCEVTLTGQTADGGVDVYLVHGDRKYLVQAKRRSSRDATEGVQVVRELAGVLLISGETRGVVVSTAARFSRAAHREASSPHLNALGYSIDLLNGRRLLDVLDVVAARDRYLPYWQELLRVPLEVSSMKHLVSDLS